LFCVLFSLTCDNLFLFFPFFFLQFHKSIEVKFLRYRTSHII
jgi:hypothetical protein